MIEPVVLQLDVLNPKWFRVCGIAIVKWVVFTIASVSNSYDCKCEQFDFIDFRFSIVTSRNQWFHNQETIVNSFTNSIPGDQMKSLDISRRRASQSVTRSIGWTLLSMKYRQSIREACRTYMKCYWAANEYSGRTRIIVRSSSLSMLSLCLAASPAASPLFWIPYTV